MPARSGATLVDAVHGSFLTCRERLGCEDADHYARRLEYQRRVHTAYRRRRGTAPAKRGRTHGTRATYHYELAKGLPTCQECRAAEADYMAQHRAARGIGRGKDRARRPAAA